jgi:hypothetical protein
MKLIMRDQQEWRIKASGRAMLPLFINLHRGASD